MQHWQSTDFDIFVDRASQVTMAVTGRKWLSGVSLLYDGMIVFQHYIFEDGIKSDTYRRSKSPMRSKICIDGLLPRLSS